MSSRVKISKERLNDIIREEYLNILSEAPPNEEEPRFGTYGTEKGAENTPAADANIDLYQKSIKALNLWAAQKGRPSARTWRGGSENSFEYVVKRLYPDEYKYVMAKAWTIPVREIPYYYGQLSGEPEAAGGEYGNSPTGKKFHQDDQQVKQKKVKKWKKYYQK